MDAARRQQLIKRRAVAKASLTRMQIFFESGDFKVNEIKVRLDKLSSILNKFEVAQDELECLDDADYSLNREEFETQYYQVDAKFNELLHPVVEQSLSRRSSPRSSLSGHSNQSPWSHVSSTHIKLPIIALPTFDGDTCNWLHYRDTFEALIVNH
jgi:DNA repair exonuclease SbcCD ATPase subunit